MEVNALGAPGLAAQVFPGGEKELEALLERIERGESHPQAVT